MTIVLVSIDAKYIHTNNAVRLLKANSSFPIDILEYTIKDDPTQMVQDIRDKLPDVIGFSVYIWNVEPIKVVLNQLSDLDATIVLGGPEVSYDSEYFLSFEAVDAIIRGEGEITFQRLLERLVKREPFADLDGIATRDGSRILVNPIVEIPDLSVLRSPHHFDSDLPHLAHRIAYVESSRGCPFRCSYCLSSLEERVRFFPVETVQTDILHLMDNGVRTIKFLDRTFNANRNTMTLLDFIIRHDNGDTVFQFEITGDILDPAIIQYLNTHARPGLFRFEIGIQSTNETTNALVDRNQDTKRLFERIKDIQRAGVIDLHLDLIAGLPMEDKASFIRTFDEVFHLGAKELQLGFLKMLRGTKIRREADKYAYAYDEQAPYEIRSNHVLSETDVAEIKAVETMLELYHNKGHFGPRLHAHILAQESPYAFFRNLAKHYDKHNYGTHRYQLEDLYQRLEETLSDDLTFRIRQDYLEHFPIKPKRYFPSTVDRQTRQTILQRISTTEHIPLHQLYKHSVLLVHGNEAFCAYYQHGNCRSYTTKAP